MNELAIEDMEGLTVMAYNCLKRSGINRVSQLCDMTEDDMKRIRNLNMKGLDNIKTELARLGYSLKPA
jgi:DNA-directed RNA polymerase alpha subunit